MKYSFHCPTSPTTKYPCILENILLLKVSTLTFILDTLIKKKKKKSYHSKVSSHSLHRLTDRNIILDLSSSPVIELQCQDFMKHRVEHVRQVRMEGLGSTRISDRRALWRRKMSSENNVKCSLTFQDFPYKEKTPWWRYFLIWKYCVCETLSTEY